MQALLERCGGDEVRPVLAQVLSSVATATGGTNVSRSTSNLAGDAAGVVVQHQEITRDGMAGSGRMGGGGTGPAVQRRSSSSSRRIQPLPLSSAAVAPVDPISFGPQLLLQEGLDERQDHARDRRNLRRAASLWQQPSSSQHTTPSQTPSFRLLERSQSARRQSYENNGKTMAIQKAQHKVLFNIGQVRRRRILLQTSSFENSTTFLSALNFHMQLIPRL